MIVPVRQGTALRAGLSRATGLGSCSALLLASAFPPIDASWIAWFALVPLIALTCSRLRGTEVFVGAWLGGVVFSLLTHWWMLEDIAPVCIVRWLIHGEVLGLCWPVGAILVRAMGASTRTRCIAFPAVWMTIEYSRTDTQWLLGFPWVHLGHTQAAHLAVIQVADIGGAYLVSYVVAAVNCLIYVAARSLVLGGERSRARCCGALAALVCLLGTVLAYGSWRVAQEPNGGGRVRIALAPRQLRLGKTDRSGKGRVGSQPLAEAVKRSCADVVIFPEVALRGVWPVMEAGATEKSRPEAMDHLLLPWSEWVEESRAKPVQALGLSRDCGCPLCFGGVRYEFSGDGFACLNSAIFVDYRDSRIEFHDKAELVPCAEYVPNDPLGVTPVLVDANCSRFTRGTDRHSFVVHAAQDRSELRIAPVICYEMAFPRCIREMTAAPDGSGLAVIAALGARLERMPNAFTSSCGGCRFSALSRHGEPSFEIHSTVLVE